MQIGVLGSGVVGQTLATGFLKHGHQVMMGTRDPQKEAEQVQKWRLQNPEASVGTFAEAAKFGDFLVLAVLGRAADNVVHSPARRTLPAKL